MAEAGLKETPLLSVEPLEDLIEIAAPAAAA